MKITGNFKCFQCFNFETSFLKNENLFFKKLENSVLVQSTMIESATFPYKTALLEANVKANRMGSTKWTYHKECTFANTYFLFLEIVFQHKNWLKIVDLKYELSKCPYSYFPKALEFYLRVHFSCEYP